MARISKIVYKSDRDKYWIYVDGEYCTSVRARTFKGMSLTEGQEITCAEIEDREKYHFKISYNKESWEKEKIRLGKVEQFINTLVPNLSVNVTGFGANSTELIREHPEEKGRPDIELTTIDGSIKIASVEVSGTETMRGNDYWVRPDKVDYAKNNPDENVWVILHYVSPKDKIVIIKPDNKKKYPYTVINIRGTDEHYVLFNDKSPEIQSPDQFKKDILGLMERLTNKG